jgi:succinate dehydrogenase / fumarate reductase cytochrome b subunit
VNIPLFSRRTPANLLRWFDPRRQAAGSWAFLINRVAGLGLTVYLFLHLAVLSQLAQGAQAYDGFIALVKNPIFLTGEFLVVAAGLLHGLNGLRIALTSFGIGVRFQKQIFFVMLALTLGGCVFFALRMFGGG